MSSTITCSTSVYLENDEGRRDIPLWGIFSIIDENTCLTTVSVTSLKGASSSAQVLCISDGAKSSQQY